MRRGEENQTQSSSPRLDSLGRTPRPSVLLAEVGAHLLSYPHSGLYAGRSRLRVGVANRGKRSIKLMNDWSCLPFGGYPAPFAQQWKECCHEGTKRAAAKALAGSKKTLCSLCKQSCGKKAKQRRWENETSLKKTPCWRGGGNGEELRYPLNLFPIWYFLSSSNLSRPIKPSSIWCIMDGPTVSFLSFVPYSFPLFRRLFFEPQLTYLNF